jgi:hypothetical protein
MARRSAGQTRALSFVTPLSGGEGEKNGPFLVTQKKSHFLLRHQKKGEKKESGSVCPYLEVGDESDAP